MCINCSSRNHAFANVRTYTPAEIVKENIIAPSVTSQVIRTHLDRMATAKQSSMRMLHCPPLPEVLLWTPAFWVRCFLRLLIPDPHKRVQLGILAVEICYPEPGERKSIYAYHDIGSQMTLLRKLTTEEIRLDGMPYIQSYRGMNIDADVMMEDSIPNMLQLEEQSIF